MFVLAIRLTAAVVLLVSALITGDMVVQFNENPQVAGGLMIAGLVIVIITGMFSVGILLASLVPAVRRLVPMGVRRS